MLGLLNKEECKNALRDIMRGNVFPLKGVPFKLAIGILLSLLECALPGILLLKLLQLFQAEKEGLLII